MFGAMTSLTGGGGLSSSSSSEAGGDDSLGNGSFGYKSNNGDSNQSTLLIGAVVLIAVFALKKGK